MAVLSKVSRSKLQTSLTAIATMGASERGVSVVVHLANTHTAAVTFDIAVNVDGSNDDYYFSGELEAKLAGREVGGTADIPIIGLDVNDIIKAKASVVDVVNCAVTFGSQT